MLRHAHIPFLMETLSTYQDLSSLAGIILRLQQYIPVLFEASSLQLTIHGVITAT